MQVGLQVCPAGTTYTWTLGCPTATEAKDTGCSEKMGLGKVRHSDTGR